MYCSELASLGAEVPSDRCSETTLSGSSGISKQVGRSASNMGKGSSVGRVRLSAST
jgi:hypothetical protein